MACAARPQMSPSAASRDRYFNHGRDAHRGFVDVAAGGKPMIPHYFTDYQRGHDFIGGEYRECCPFTEFELLTTPRLLARLISVGVHLHFIMLIHA